MRILDLFCGAGGAAMGLHRAGFEVVGVDIKPQPNYPFEFHLADALEYPLDGFDAYWASPPCQRYSRIRKLTEAQGIAKRYPKLIERTRVSLRHTEKPYIIENVPGAPLIDPVVLCGSFFGLSVQRHRIFESNIALWCTPCAHYSQTNDKPPLHRHQGKKSRVVGCYGNGRGKGDNKALWQAAMGITWMTRKELSQAIPPAYSEFLGKQLMEHMKTKE